MSYDLATEWPEKPDECAACSYETPYLKRYTNGSPRRKRWLCFICASTFAGNAQAYPQLYPNARVLFAVSEVANMILDAIFSGKDPRLENVEDQQFELVWTDAVGGAPVETIDGEYLPDHCSHKDAKLIAKAFNLQPEWVAE